MANPFEEADVQVNRHQITPKKKKTKGIIIGVVIAIIAIAAAITMFFLFPRERFHFRNVNLGMTLEEVQAAEKGLGYNAGFTDSPNYKVENIEAYGMLVNILYAFFDDSLLMIIVSPADEIGFPVGKIRQSFLNGLEKEYGSDYEERNDTLVWDKGDYYVFLTDEKFWLLNNTEE